MYRYSKSTPFSGHRSNVPLTNDQIAYYAPSVVADGAHESRGDRYTFIPTIAVIDGLRREGFQPFEVQQTRVRDISKREHTKHMVRLRHADAAASDGEVGEIILLNSHDGSSSYQLLSGFFRFVCNNGLIAGDVTNDIRVRHSGNVVDNVIEGATRILDDLQIAQERVETFKSITLAPEEQTLFANAALSLRWDADSTPVTADRVLIPNRWDDRKNDLWTTFNRVQESLVKGGVHGRGKTGRRLTTRAVAGVNENVKLNRALWSLADGMANLKQNVIDIEELVAA
jgi:hypothetical protein